ncbi:hypothetical protein [Actinoplanes xinjiangensis]|nr:hypothetical protein [Actinoplanes xinjiangensis]GIF37170.1 hypothetical protein Axi01nite_14810 [Actinoplanes xinjiangensis]
MKYLEPGSPLMALKWMTALEQCLGWVRRDGRLRIRWVRVDPRPEALTVPGILVTSHEADLVGAPRLLRRLGATELDPDAALPPDFIIPDESEALLTAERETGARRDRWVNEAVEGWAILRELRGHP